MIRVLDAEAVSGAQCLLGEGPYWDERDAIWFSDIDGRQLHRLDWPSLAHESVSTGEGICFIGGCSSGEMVVGLEQSVGRGSLPVTQVTMELSIPPTSRINDGGCDLEGRLFLGTTDRQFRDGHGTLLKITDEGAFTVLSNLSISNGLAWTHDGKSMVHVDTLRRSLFIYPYDRDTGLPSGRPRVIDLSGIEGLPDGCAIDIEDRIWVAMWGGGQVVCVDLKGKIREIATVPTSHVTSCCFVGAGLEYLFVTSASPVGHESQLAGRVFICEPSAPGAKVPQCSTSACG